MHIRGATSSDISVITDLIADAFDLRPGMGAAYAGVYCDLMAGEEEVTGSRVAERDGAVVGHALVIPRRMAISGVEVPAGVVAFVVVRQKFQGQGVGSALMADAIRWMQDRGFLASHLSGAAGFYRRFGYVEAYRRSVGRLKVAGVPVYGGPVVVREAREGDAGALRDLSAREHAGRTGDIRRETADWAWQLRAGHPGRYAGGNEGLVGFRAEERCLVAERGGAAVGYLRLLIGTGRILVHEGAAQDDAAASALMACAREGRGGGVELLVPSDGTVGRWAVAQGAAFEEGFDPEALVKVIDAPALLRRLAPVLAERVRGSALRGRSVRLWIETERGRFGLGVTPEGVAVDETSQEADWRVTLPEIGLTQMIFGTRDYAALIRDRAGAGEGLSDWIAVLFPEQRPTICLGDMF